MRTIYKYPVSAGDFVLEMPAGARILSVQAQGRYPQLWAIVDTDQHVEERRFLVLP